MTRVFPDPAPAWMTSGPRVMRTATAWSGSRPSRSSSGSSLVIDGASGRPRGASRPASPGERPLDPAVGDEPDDGHRHIERDGDGRDREGDDESDRIEE